MKSQFFFTVHMIFFKTLGFASLFVVRIRKTSKFQSGQTFFFSAVITGTVTTSNTHSEELS